ncbi:SDR family oxidoreductase [Candidatus Saccharibacteria bacterium]|nr:SDR family oxidoreductase [Candidatus Saccharibacteria bacterium]NIW79292.1 SDR family oxidoreductase [Calditrichia bacterium]
MKIEDSIILITGSARRVGKSIALTLAEKGAQVILHYNASEHEISETAEQIAKIGKTPMILQGDISRSSHWIQMKNNVMAEFQRIDGLINNAAIFYKTPLLETTEKQWDQFMDVNLKGVFLGCQCFGEVMYQQKQGKIINIADVAAENVWSGYIPYCVSKAGVIALTRGLAKALAPYVTVNAIAPGTVLLAESYDEEEEQRLIDKTPLKRVGDPQDIANTAVFLLEGSDFVNGTIIKVDGGRSLM